MHLFHTVLCFVLPILAAAQSQQSSQVSQSNSATQSQQSQSNSNSSSTSQSLILSTSFTTGVTLGPSRVESTFTSSVVFTLTPTPTQSQSSGNNTSNSNSSSSSASSTGPLPTAPTNIDGGGNGPNGAPNPGAAAPNGVYGPPDSYTAAALALHANTILAVVGGFALGGTLVFA